MELALPDSAFEFMNWTADQIQPHVDELTARPLTTESIDGWLLDTQKLGGLFQASLAWLDIATEQNTADEDAKHRAQAFRRDIFPLAMRLYQTIDKRILEHEAILPPGFEIPLRAMKVNVELFDEAAVPLWNEEARLCGECSAIYGAQTVMWQGSELTLRQLRLNLQEPDRAVREQAWWLLMARRAEDRDALNSRWSQLLDTRRKLAAVFHFPDYIHYRFREMGRFDYTPEDSLAFHDAIEAAVVPALKRVLERRRQQLGVATLRPWDLEVDPTGKPPLRPFKGTSDLIEKGSRVFYRLDSELGAYFDHMHTNGLLDLDNRKNKGAATGFTRIIAGVGTFLFMNLTGTHREMVAIMHEMGHAFQHHRSHIHRYAQQMPPPSDFAETPSMVMEMLSMPCWDEFYQGDDLKRAQNEYLIFALRFWVEHAMIDAFQHWAYTCPDDAADPTQCDSRWAVLVERFMPGLDWSGIEDLRGFGWQELHPIFLMPLFSMEYGFGQYAAVQVWREVLQDHQSAIQRYKSAISFGSTVTVPEMFAALNTPFPFDADDLRGVIATIEAAISE